jgi:hypothetical protein
MHGAVIFGTDFHQRLGIKPRYVADVNITLRLEGSFALISYPDRQLVSTNRPVRSAAQANTGTHSFPQSSYFPREVSQAVWQSVTTTLLPSRELMAHTLTFPRETTANYYPLETCETRALFHRKNSEKTAGSTPLLKQYRTSRGGHCDPHRDARMSDAQRASILRTLQASDIWVALRLPANAAADVVRQAFRRESRLLHPDKNPMPEAEAQVSHSAPTACTAGPARTSA